MLLPHDATESAAYRQSLLGVCEKRIRCHLLDRSGDVVESLSRSFYDGSVTVDTSTDVTRSANVQIFDPRHRYGFDADTYSGGDLDLTRLVHVEWVVDSDLLTKTVPVDVMYGPVTRLTREGPIVTIEVQGQEVFGLRPGRRTLTFRKGARKTDVIRAILRDRMGITRMHIPDIPGRTSVHVVIHPKDLPWKTALKIAQSMNRQLYFDGAGVARLRPYPKHATWHFKGGINGGSLTSDLNTEGDLTKVVNRVKVVGRTPKATKTDKNPQPFSWTAAADPSDALSAVNLGPPGAPLFMDVEIQNDHLRHNQECRDVAERVLDQRMHLARTVAFNAAPVPHLDPHDVISASTDFESIQKSLDTFTLPLGLGGDMQVGYTGPYRLHKKKGRRKRD